MSDPEAVRAACNAEGPPDTGVGCMYPWCVCNRLPDIKAESSPTSSPDGEAGGTTFPHIMEER